MAKKDGKLRNGNFKLVNIEEMKKSGKTLYQQEDPRDIVLFCAQEKEKFMNGLAEGLLATVTVETVKKGEHKETCTLNEAFEMAVFAEETKGADFTFDYDEWGFIFEYAELDFDLREGKKKEADTLFVVCSLQKMIETAYEMVENEEDCYSEEAEQFVRMLANADWFMNTTLEEFKKKSLFKKGSYTVRTKKPELLKDLEERFNKILNKKGMFALILPDMYEAYKEKNTVDWMEGHEKLNEWDKSYPRFPDISFALDYKKNPSHYILDPVVQGKDSQKFYNALYRREKDQFVISKTGYDEKVEPQKKWEYGGYYDGYDFSTIIVICQLLED